MAIKRVHKKRIYTINKICRFCVENRPDITYKDTKTLQSMISERGKMMPRRISGNCAPHQRQVALSVKRARNLALLPFSVRS